MEDTILDILEGLGSGTGDERVTAVNKLDELLANQCMPDQTKRSKTLTSHLHGRPQLKEFLKLQDNYAYNIASRMAPVLDKMETTEQKKLLLDCLQGLCLLHYPSRKVFSNDRFMTKLVKFLDPNNEPELHIRAINTLVSVMVREVRNIRKFEELDGLLHISTLFKSKEVSKEVKLRILEFLFFYLIPETQTNHVRSDRKTTEEKARMLEKYLSNVSGLVRELNMSKPFGDMNLEW
ncbi:hypothetical protein TRICI_005482 [Trichomonascus ciferrii]|uniref:Cell division control protein 14 n=1 Tax=Trichomonascus ciferrii TaxID=44093 RepID=A0A642USF2_9ASCO|nr:hypothetical protein TRICI_005482 [Trichomonascus ciferrii]